MRSVDIGTIGAEELPDLGGVAFDNTLSHEERIAHLLQMAYNPYCFRVGDVGVQVVFAEDGPALQDEFESYTEYVDDGHTGTDTDCEDFQRLLADVMSGKINCVIVKDLSRLSCNYSDAGSLIENLFVQLNIRFISLAESVDSFINPDSVSSIIVPITNVMNDNYCYQTSKKIRQVFDYKRRNGQYISSIAPYGYIKHPKDKHQLMVDPEAAENVKHIFKMCLQGTSKHAITLHLNEHGVPTPLAYRRLKGYPLSTSSDNDTPMWSPGIIGHILKNPIYIGDLVQG